MQPLLDVVKGFGIRHVIDHNNAVGAAVIGRSNCSKALLASRIPNLELDGLGIEFDRADFLKQRHEKETLECTQLNSAQ